MGHRRTFLAASALALLMILAGCATDRRDRSLQTTLTAYAATVRWGTFAQAVSFLDPAYRNAHPLSDLDMARYRQVRVSEYDAGNGPVPVGKYKVKQVVRIGLINVHTQTERTIIDRQTWRYDPDTRHWWLTSGLPDITPSQ